MRLPTRKQGYYNLPYSNYKLKGVISEDVVLVGLGYDEGSRFKGSQRAPTYLRSLSQKIYIGKNRFLMNVKDGLLTGFFNHQNNNLILRGKTIADYGNVDFRDLDSFFSLLKPSSTLIMIGGDHTITYHILSNLKNRNPFSVFYFDAHEDYGEKSSCCKNNNVISWIRSLKNIEGVFQIGLRGYSCNPRSKGAFDHIYPPDAEICFEPQEIKQDCYISIDLDVLDPRICLAVSTPVMNGIEYADLKSILLQIFTNYRVIGIDIVEFFPKKDRDFISGMLVLDLILYLLELINSYT